MGSISGLEPHDFGPAMVSPQLTEQDKRREVEGESKANHVCSLAIVRAKAEWKRIKGNINVC